MRALARRIQHLEPEIAEHDTEMETLLDQAAPQLLATRGIGRDRSSAKIPPTSWRSVRSVLF